MSDMGAALQMIGVSKRYTGTLAVDSVDLTVCSGEVHALVGGNGAGKSTLVKIMAGAFSDYTGRVLLNGKEIQLHSPAAARANGIQMIHQELSLAPALSVMENVLAGRLPRRGPFVSRRRALAEAGECLSRVGLGVDPLTPVEDLSQHEAQLVEIAKALANRPCILLLDEPTSALGRNEVERLFALIRRMRSMGLAIVYISHHLPEIMAIADRVTVMRDGRWAATERARDVTTETLASLMVGVAASRDIVRARADVGAQGVRVESLTRYGFFCDISFSIHAGEVVGLAGLSGSGRTELARSLCGIDPVDEGDVYLNDERITARSLRQAVRSGIAYVTEDRKTLGLALRLTTGENALSVPVARGRNGSRNHREEAIGLLARLRVAPPDTSRTVRDLSGGNQQKVLLTKWLVTRPKLLILDEPTRGVDVGARAAIHEAISEAARQGAAVLLISSDIPELVGLSNRILVLRRGRLCGELQSGDATEEKVLLAVSSDEQEVPA